MSWIMEDGSHPTQSSWNNFILDIFSSPVPKGLFVVEESYPRFNWNPVNAPDKPLPFGLFTIYGDDYPKFGHWNILNMGAFMNSTNLQDVKIPMSVNTIEKWSFTNTQLKNVELSNDCTYSDTSFPKDCVVTGGKKETP